MRTGWYDLLESTSDEPSKPLSSCGYATVWLDLGTETPGPGKDHACR